MAKNVIRPGLARALALSLLAHAALILLLHRPGTNSPAPMRAPIRVNMRQPVPPPPPAPAPIQQSSTTSPERAADAGPEDPAAAATSRDWSRQAREVVRGMDAPTHNPYTPLELDSVKLQGSRETVPGVEAAFRPRSRPLKRCGFIATLDLGNRKVEMPVAYLCEDKTVEYRNAPGAGRYIGDPPPPGMPYEKR